MLIWIKHIAPPRKWLVPVIIMSGIFFGLFFYAFYISKAPSYLSDKPETCVNCHIMAPEYASWQHSSHRERATCNDCHVPHDNVFRKYYFKAQDGMRHATIFTLRAEPEVIQIKQAGEKVVQQNCIRCHSNLITDSRLLTKTSQTHHYRTKRQCWECHREVPHGKEHGISTAPNALVPVPGSPVPEWLRDIVNPSKQTN